MKKGLHSTEFWMSALSLLGIAGSVLAHVTAPWAVAAVTVINVVYTAARTALKVNEPAK